MRILFFLRAWRRRCDILRFLVVVSFPELLILSGCGGRQAVHFDPRTQPASSISWHPASSKIPSSFPLTGIHQSGERIQVVGDSGTFVQSKDGGRTWVGGTIDKAQGHNLNSTFGIGEELWIVGDHGILLYSSDGGQAWTALDSGTTENLNSVRGDGQRFLAVGSNGAIVQSFDGGSSWHYRPYHPERWSGCNGMQDAPTLSSVEMEGEEAWVAGVCGLVLYSNNQGRTWTVEQSRASQNLTTIARRGRELWAAGNFVIIYSPDGGRTWWPQLNPVNAVFFSVSPAANQLWLTGSSGVMLRSADSGLNWNVCRSTGSANIIAVLETSQGLLAVGMDGSLLDGEVGPPYPAPKELAIETVETGVRLSFRVEPKMEPYPTATLSGSPANLFLQQRPPEIKTHSETADTASDEWAFTFNPEKELRVNKSERIRLLITLASSDFRQAFMLATVTYAPWDFVERHWPAIGGASALAFLFVVLTGLLYLSPKSLLWLQNRIGVYELLDKLPAGEWMAVAQFLARATILPFFAEHPRCLDAWCEQYGKRVSEEFLRSADLLQSLPEFLQASAQDGTRRRVKLPYAQVPVALGATGEALSANKGAFAKLFAGPSTLIQIVGRGGSGKSFLAMECGRWAADRSSPTRLVDHPMLPILVDEEFSDLLTTIQGKFFYWLGEKEKPNVLLLRALLREKRLLLVLDRTSERSLATKEHIRTAHRDNPFNAMIITSREVIEMPDRVPTLLYPQPLAEGSLVDFIKIILPAFSGSGSQSLTAAGLADRLQRGIVARPTPIEDQKSMDRRRLVSPLLVALYVQRACSLLTGGSTLDTLAISLPDVYFDYLCSLNPIHADVTNRMTNQEMLSAAEALARLALGKDFVPREFSRKFAEKVLREDHPPNEGRTDALQRLLDNGVLAQARAGTEEMFRFALDPVAEYLAAMNIAQECGLDPDMWNAMQKEIIAAKAKDFCVVMSMIWEAYRERFRWPDRFDCAAADLGQRS
jgi:photosystem II stability/assembly factor-like uncharacterized protein